MCKMQLSNHCHMNGVLKQDKQCNYIITLRRVRVNFVVLERLSIRHSLCISSLSYLASKEHAPYYVAICGLSGSTILFNITS